MRSGAGEGHGAGGGGGGFMASHGGKSQPWGGGHKVGFAPLKVGGGGWMAMAQGHKAVCSPPKSPGYRMCGCASVSP